MNPRHLLTATAVVHAALAIWALFLPNEIARGLELGAGASVPIQLVGAGLWAFAALNWTGRGAIYGGIYGRPIVVANFVLGVVVFGISASGFFDGRLGSAGWILIALFGVQTILFFRLMRSPPWTPKPESQPESQ